MIVGGVLCGGLGKRLRPLTDSVPKPLLEIGRNFTILDRLIMQMKHAKIFEVYLLAGYQHEKLVKRYGENWQDIHIHYIIEDKPRGTLYAINSLLKNVDSDLYLVMNGDIVTDINISRMISEWKPGTVSIALTLLRSPYGIVQVSGETITGFEEKPMLPHYINAGIYLIDAGLKHRFLEHNEGDVEKLVFPKLAEEGLLRRYFEADAYWKSVDTLKDLEEVRMRLSNQG
ncbi:MAG: nucleotidyltransferase family protein [Thaumarchaeota archaeon]|jgi:NDP-sugar pyrophosphorylase family protein|nr:nucleotidyltransferase family protein [Nitrososphaerota archaeon]